MYLDTNVKRFDVEKCFIPMRYGIHVSKGSFPKTLEGRALMEKIMYTLVIRSIMYDMLCTRPKMIFDLSFINRLQAQPSEKYFETIEYILKYISTKDLFLLYEGEEL